MEAPFFLAGYQLGLVFALGSCLHSFETFHVASCQQWWVSGLNLSYALDSSFFLFYNISLADTFACLFCF
jgi:hypothetical protein